MLPASSSLVHRRSVGDVSIVQLSDGAVRHGPARAFFGLNADAASFEAVSQAGNLSSDIFNFPATATLVETKGERILIDAGHGFRSGPSAGHLPKALEEAGVSPEIISHVVLTHLHCDHIGGLLDESGDPVFANASHRVSPLEHAYWMGPGSNTSVGRVAQDLLNALGCRLTFITPGEELVRGVSTIDSAGHTPGHLCVLVESKGDRLLVAGDLANHPVWAVTRPNWHMSLDVDPVKAACSRCKILGWLADEKVPMAGYHMPFPALGMIERDAESFRYVPEVS